MVPPAYNGHNADKPWNLLLTSATTADTQRKSGTLPLEPPLAGSPRRAAVKKDRRSSDRRRGQGRRCHVRSQESPRIPTWEEQRAQHLTRYVFCLLAILYFNVGEAPRVSRWFTPTGISA